MPAAPTATVPEFGPGFGPRFGPRFGPGDNLAAAPAGARRGLFIKTYGCQMNVYDSGRMADLLAPQGFVPVSGPDDAELVILNTCHIREKAEDKLFSDLGRLRQVKIARAETGRTTLIAVGGCVAQAQGAEILRRAPYVDLVFGPQTYHRLPQLVARAKARADAVPARGIVDTEFPPEPKFDALPGETVAPGISAFLAIQEGCDKFCAFCVVPYTRGAEYSRPLAAVLAEARRLVASGARELTLLGQNVNAYHGAGADGGSAGLGQVIRALAEIPGLARLRYTTSHPRDVDAAQIAAHREVEALMPFLHLPVQSGSDRVLAQMNRGHTIDHYRRTIAALREARPDIAFSTDLIVGFPGETDADFEATLTLAREIEFAQAFSFRYSARPGTPAANRTDTVPDDVAQARLWALQDLLEAQQRRFNDATIGRTLPVLFEKPGRHPGQAIGRSPYLQGVHAEVPADRIGAILPVRVVGATLNSLEGVLDGAAGGVRDRRPPGEA